MWKINEYFSRKHSVQTLLHASCKKKKMALLFHHYISQRATYKKIESPESSAELLKYYPNTFHSFP